MTLDDMKLIYTYLNGYLSEDEIIRFEQKMQDPEFCAMFVQFIEDEELIQRAMSEIKVPRHTSKTVKKFVRKAITFAAAAACIVFGYLYYEKNNFMANLNAFRGDVQLNRGSGEVELIDQVKIKRGDIIETEVGNCSIKFRDGTVVDIKPFSTLKIEEESGKLLILNKGKLYSDVTPQKKGKQMTIQTPAGKVSVLGTQLSVDAKKDKLNLEVFEGKVIIKNNTGSSTEVKAGEYAVAEDNIDIVAQKNPNMSDIQKKIEQLKYKRWLEYSFEIRKDKDLVAYYDFQLIEGNLLQNKATYTRQLPLNGNIRGGKKVLGRWINKGALYFSNNSFVDCGNHETFNLTGPMTIFVWFKVTRFNSHQQTLISKADSAWRLARYQTTDNLEMAGSGLTPDQWTIGNVKVDDNQWHMATGVYDGKEISLYIDGHLDTKVAASGTVKINNAMVLIGSNISYDDRFFNGWIDEIGVYKKALNPIEIRKMYERGEP